MMSLQERIITEAMDWIGTPYMHHARVKGAGVDCAQFPIAVYSACSVFEAFDLDYGHQWHLHRDDERYLDYVQGIGDAITREDVRAGDFAIWKWGRSFSHGGIMLDEARVIHAYIGVGVTIDEIDRNEELKVRPRLFFRLKGVFQAVNAINGQVLHQRQ
jgi:cell wall-associated NlpC family hydrolase